jgi:glycosidase
MATMGELLILIGEQLVEPNPEYRQGLARLLDARRRYPALCAGAGRVQIHTQDDSRFYAYLRYQSDENLLVLLNFQAEPQTIDVTLPGDPPQSLIDIFTDEVTAVQPSGKVSVDLPAFGYRVLQYNGRYS